MQLIVPLWKDLKRKLLKQIDLFEIDLFKETDLLEINLFDLDLLKETDLFEIDLLKETDLFKIEPTQRAVDHFKNKAHKVNDASS